MICNPCQKNSSRWYTIGILFGNIIGNNLLYLVGNLHGFIEDIILGPLLEDKVKKLLRFIPGDFIRFGEEKTLWY